MSEDLETNRASPEKDITHDAVKVKFEDDDPKNPKNYSSSHKAFLVVQMAMLALAGSLGSSIISPAATSIAEYTHTTSEVTPLTVALFVLGWAFGPMIWAPISEVYGRRMGMLPAVFILGLFSIGTATSRSATAIFLTRFFGGIFASAPISNVPAALGDIFEPATRGNAMTIVAFCITGGANIRSCHWLCFNGTEYIEGTLVFILFLICAFCLPETYAPVLLKEKAQDLRRSTGDQRYWHPHEKEKIEISTVVTKHLARPLKMLFTEPMVACLALYASFTYSLIYLVLEVFPIVFNENRKWSLIVSTLPFLSILVGVGCAVFINFANQPRYKRAAKANCGKAVPEARLPPIIVGAILLSVGLFWFGWTAAPKYPWPLPVIAAGTGFIGAGFNIAFQQCLNFLVDTYGPYAASAVSANTILRSVLACAMPMAARPMFVNLGIGPAASLLGGISCVALPVPLLFMRYGAALREKSKFVDRE
ncbi:major facilitator superfamily domain-containing protein [Penicillium waksmanii]|uniref:major facilitator superfamily domain-containing protein n=1 Tax=Penicillium waksmanii TaxID=69791 RepID=UPI0025477CA2|nr:major facilitator superfamily domain-containing protein [Penicillium waksmanii]KAJ5974589.1 major facilitator superfamily domain-containing protein [Penicillium waksmanii]